MNDNVEKELTFFRKEMPINKSGIQCNTYTDCMLDFIPCILLAGAFFFSFAFYPKELPKESFVNKSSYEQIYKKNSDGTIDRKVSDGSTIRIYHKGKFFRKINDVQILPPTMPI